MPFRSDGHAQLIATVQHGPVLCRLPNGVLFSVRAIPEYGVLEIGEVEKRRTD